MQVRLARGQRARPFPQPLLLLDVQAPVDALALNVAYATHPGSNVDPARPRARRCWTTAFINALPAEYAG